MSSLIGLMAGVSKPTMLARYHIQITRAALGDTLPPDELATVIRANLGQDSISNLLSHPEVHFDDSRFAEGLRFIEAQRRLAVQALGGGGDRVEALQAFGRLLHARQDFYAHSNWVRLWVESHGGIDHCTPEQVEVCHDPLSVPQLASGTASVPRYLVYRIPGLGRLVKRFYLPADSHEAMNLDSPKQGPLFAFAVAAATKHTGLELDLLVEAIQVAAGDSVVRQLVGA